MKGVCVCARTLIGGGCEGVCVDVSACVWGSVCVSVVMIL